MAIATSTAIMGGAALAGSAFQFAKGKEQEKEGNQAFNEFERQELENIYKNMPISLLGSNIRREDQSQMTSNLVQSAQGTGIRGVMGMLPRIQASNTKANRDNMLDVDNQVMKRAYSIAGDEGRIQQMQEARDNADLAGIGQELAVGQQNTMSGISGAFNGLGLLGSGIEGTIGGGGGAEALRQTELTQMNSVPQLNSMGAIPMSSGIPSVTRMPRVEMSQLNTLPSMPGMSPSLNAPNLSPEMAKYLEYQRNQEAMNGVFGGFN